MPRNASSTAAPPVSDPLATDSTNDILVIDLTDQVPKRESSLPTPDPLLHPAEPTNESREDTTENNASLDVTVAPTPIQTEGTNNQRVARPNAKHYERIEGPAKKAFTQKLRWYYLCHLNVDDVQSLIVECYPDVERTSEEWSVLVQHTKELAKNWKSRTLRNMQSRISSIVDLSHDHATPLRLMTDEEALSEYFYTHFNEGDFYSCFKFVAGILDIKHTSEPGLSYLRNLWANLATKVKLWVDAVRSDGRDAALARGRWEVVKKYWQEITVARELSGARREMFAEVTTTGVAGKKRQCPEAPPAPRFKTFFRGTPITPGTPNS
ncbi:uncharacterized protein N7515_004991 [Penicillium bovifimosum]|uniref:Uncharacterized protein n=1 Tax=Penicillium bovifimosum TaxID=126998 RepID=A0A9W9H2S1_9EURO|nr:uncharacterized protein N7515_004991 [Penicillium bovifimosum]KAJ5135713.1 hypothetical protein N7515_004991 [Penicillium bovifimosum]